jgi:hypothetical protein
VGKKKVKKKITFLRIISLSLFLSHMCTLGLKPSRRFTISSDEHGPSNHVCAAASEQLLTSTHSAITNMFSLSDCVSV